MKLVQFHPSYSYEDFFEGFRPVQRDDGQLTFKLEPGPFRLLVEAARQHRQIPTS
jgi:5-methylcytosine-specific restriction protein B